MPKASVMGEYIPQLILMMSVICMWLYTLKLVVSIGNEIHLVKVLRRHGILLLMLMLGNLVSFLLSIFDYPLWAYSILTAAENVLLCLFAQRDSRAPTLCYVICQRKKNTTVKPALLTNCVAESTTVEQRGVTLSFFINWARFHSKKYPGLRTRDLVTNIITPDTRNEPGPYWIKVPQEDRGPPDVFISHAWDMYVDELVDAIVDWDAHYSSDCCWGCGCCFDFCCHKIESQILRDPILWIDIFAIPQNKGFHNTNDVQMLDKTIGSIGHVVLCTDLEYTPMTRSWCLFELANAYRFNTKTDFGLSGTKCSHSSARSVPFEPFQDIDVENADTSNPQDKKMINSLIIEQFESFQFLNQVIQGMLRRHLAFKYFSCDYDHTDYQVFNRSAVTINN